MSPDRWVATRLYPAQCATVRIDVHTQGDRPLQSVSVEISNPHTKELEAMVTRPAENYGSADEMVSMILLELQQVLVELFDPDPF